MGRIAFIAPYEEILTIGEQVVAKLGLSEKIEGHVGLLNQGVDIARRAEANGTEVIIARGGTAELIAKAGVQVPIVEIPISIQDLSEALLNAKKVTGRDNPKIAMLAFKNMMPSLEVFAKIMHICLTIYQIDSEEEIKPAVERALQDGMEVIIGGIKTITLAAERGANTVLLKYGEDSYREAVLQAVKVLYARTLEKERMKKFRVLVDYSIQGIIGIDSDKKISVFNNSAERLLSLDSQQVIGKNIDSLFPMIPLEACLNEAKATLGELIKINNKKLMANIIPIDVGEAVKGAMITIEDVGQIVEMEATIRNEMYSKGLAAEYQFTDILGSSERIAEVKRIALEYAAIDATVLITGESGTGKELYAQSIHNASKRRQRPFVAVNCGAIPASLLESELFGYVEGAFTGAHKKGKPGLFELAHGGTIFLDEIGEMDKLAQTSLLRVIQERRVMRLGGDKYLPIDVRIIAATNRNLTQLIKEGTLREDLYYRINVLPLELPSLRECQGDALFIAEHFLSVYNKMFSRNITLDKQARTFIGSYEWPGNIRELRNYIERLVVTTKEGMITAETAVRILGPVEKNGVCATASVGDNNVDKDLILRVLTETKYNQKEAAKRLGIDRSTLYRKLKALNMQVKKVCSS
jgi:transcriptional regulator with PAS, ATPase and Fis domain